MTELLLYGSTFVTVFALGFQSLNVNQGRYIAAFLTSFVIGGSSLVLYRYLPQPTWTQVLAYLLGGSTGIVASMWMHKRTIGRKPRVDRHPPWAEPEAKPHRRIVAGRPVSFDLGYQPIGRRGNANPPTKKP